LSASIQISAGVLLYHNHASKININGMMQQAGKVTNTFSQSPYFTTRDTKFFHKDHKEINRISTLTH